MPTWRCGESNPVPLPCEDSALPDELHPRAQVTEGESNPLDDFAVFPSRET